eukprot:TRINITY_DN2005_c0_g1_i4.p2 TRINITY_DN2005_c0_g1~~TRINITY_DN2005_c0_g1_i4.p2  ORF type:complete len:168 (+),score=28.35 TRINITY_DN2005_c0_g1_i4:234-737(+)
MEAAAGHEVEEDAMAAEPEAEAQAPAGGGGVDTPLTLQCRMRQHRRRKLRIPCSTWSCTSRLLPVSSQGMHEHKDAFIWLASHFRPGNCWTGTKYLCDWINTGMPQQQAWVLYVSNERFVAHRVLTAVIIGAFGKVCSGHRNSACAKLSSSHTKPCATSCCSSTAAL